MGDFKTIAGIGQTTTFISSFGSCVHHYREFFKKMKVVCGYPRHLILVPRPLIKTAGQAGSFYEKLSGKAVPLNAVNANLLSGNNYYSAQKAVREPGLPQRPIDKAIADAVEWFQKR